MALSSPRRIASAAQCRAARALLGWSQQHLASRAGVARKTVADFELGNRVLHRRTVADITAALERAGIMFAADLAEVRVARFPAMAGQVGPP